MFKLVLSSVVFCLSIGVYAAPENVTSAPASTSEEGRFSINIEPLWVLISGLGAGVDYNVTNKLSIGASALKVFSYSVEGTESELIDDSYTLNHDEFSLNSVYMLTGDLATKGFYISPAVGYMSREITDYGSLNLQAKADAPFIRLTAGARWSANNNISFLAGLGLTRATKNSEIIVKDSSGNILKRDDGMISGLALDLKMLYTF